MSALSPEPSALLRKLATAPDGFPESDKGRAMARKAIALVTRTHPAEADVFRLELFLIGYAPDARKDER